MGKILIFGATGSVGVHTALMQKEGGYKVCAVVYIIIDKA